MCNIHKRFGGVEALKGVDLSCRPGEILALVGENGAGKSTLIKVLSGAHKADEGEIYIKGERVDIKDPLDGIRHGVSVIYQEFALVNDITVAENIFIDEYRNKKGRIDWDDLFDRAAFFLNEVGFGNISPRAIVGNLSVAYQQVVEICKALSRNASILVLDEPTAVLTSKEAEHLFELMDKLRDKGVAIIYISHRLQEIFRKCTRVTVMKDGSTVGTVNVCDVDEMSLANMMVGREMNEFFPQREFHHFGEIALKAEHISAGKMVKDISFDVREGEVLGLSGLVGSGRSEAVRSMLGITRLDSGKVILKGKEVTFNSAKEAFDAGIGYLPEDRKREGVILTLPVGYNITLSCLKRFCNKFGRLNLQADKDYALYFSKKLSIKIKSLADPVNTLSGGNQQKVAIARLLATGSKIMILDEPTRGVDVGAKVEIYDLINQMVDDKYAVIIISSEMAEVIGMCDRAVVVHEGNSIGTLEREELTEENIIQFTLGVSRNVLYESN